MKIIVYPLEGIEIEGIKIRLGMERDAVETALGKGEFIGKRYYYYHSEMAIDYDSNSRVEFIEFLGGIDGLLKPIIYNFSAFDTNADELVDLLKQKNGNDIDNHERGYSYYFKNISVGIYREMRPSDILEMIEEMKADGIATENNEDLEAYKRRAEHWATIGIGIGGYYH